MLDGECVVWWTRTGDVRPWHLQLLDDRERQRLAALRRPDDRARFTLGAVLLRLMVGHHLDQPPAAVLVDRTCAECGRPHGRPRVGGDQLFASVSHSGERVVAALTGSGPVGVDVERVVDLDIAALLDTVLSVEERGAVRSRRDFFRTWTRKEAVLKATGDGLLHPMNEVVVSAPRHDPPRLVRFDGRPDLRAGLWDLSPARGYAAAVAVLGSVPAVREWNAGTLVRGGIAVPGSGHQDAVGARVHEAADADEVARTFDTARRP